MPKALASIALKTASTITNGNKLLVSDVDSEDMVDTVNKRSRNDNNDNHHHKKVLEL